MMVQLREVVPYPSFRFSFFILMEERDFSVFAYRNKEIIIYPAMRNGNLFNISSSV